MRAKRETANEKSRFDAKIPATLKISLERAAVLGGYKSLTEFVFSSAQEKAEVIIKKHEDWLATEEAKRVFFDALINPPKPNSKLKDAFKYYKKMMNK